MPGPSNLDGPSAGPRARLMLRCCLLAISAAMGAWPVAAAAQVAPGARLIHAVAPGETLYAISRTYGRALLALVRANGLEAPYKVRAGQRLIIPGGPPAPTLIRVAAAQPAAPVSQPEPAVRAPKPVRPKTGVHIVAAGETLYSIARTYGQDVIGLAAANGIAPPYIIRVGQKLTIPGSPHPRPTAVGAAPPRPTATPPADQPEPPSTGDQPRPPASPQPPTKAPPSGPETPPAPPQPATPALPSETVTTSPRAGRRTVTVSLPLRDGRVYLGDVDATISPDGALALNVAQVQALMTKVQSKAAQDAFAAALAGKTTAPLADFKAAGVAIDYDTALLQLTAHIPSASRPRLNVEIANIDQTLVGEVIRPAPFSAYMNVRAATDYVHEGSNRGLGADTVQLDGAARFGGFVLENQAHYLSKGLNSGFGRDATRLVYDDFQHLVRWTAGDLQLQTRGFQGAPDLAGLSFVRLYNQLQPQQNIRPRGERSFQLDQAATVETFINGRSVQRTRLDPGTYDLNNFPFVDGANDVRVVIEDDTGRRESLAFSIFFDRTLLAKGLSEFGAFAGVRSNTNGRDRTYGSGDGTFTGFYRRGFSDRLTAGFNLQADRHVQAVGVEGLFAVGIGTLGFDVAGSDSDRYGSGYAVNLGLTRLVQSRDSFRSETLSASVETRSKDFMVVGALLPSNPYSWQAAVSYSRSFSQYSYAAVDLRYAVGRGTQNDVSSARATFGYRVSDDSNLALDMGYASGGFNNGASVRLSFTKRLGRTRNVRAEYDTANDDARLSYQDSHGRGVGSWSVSADVDRTPANAAFSGGASYALNRADVGLSHTASYDNTRSRISDERTSIRGAFSLATTGSSIGIGRPIYDSFALFDGHPSLKGAPIVVDRTTDGALANSGPFGPAVLNDLGSYSVRTVTYDAPNAPPGYDIGQGTVRMLPPYRSGYHITVGSDYAVTVIGRLLDSDGTPVPLLAGKAFDLADPKHPPVILFTSRDGRFGAQGLRAGRWRIEMPTSPPSIYQITIPKEAGALYRSGDLKPQSGGGQ